MNIRNYVSTDWPYICSIFDRAKPDEMLGSCDLQAIVPLQQDTQLLEQFNCSDILVAELDEKILGFAGYCRELITWLFVDPEHYRQGIGSRLLEAVLAEISGNACLYVARYNESAKSLYLRKGFRIEREYTGKYNGYEAEAIFMILHG